jgi:PAT family beta-lactamase induction signal transducer AmpG
VDVLQPHETGAGAAVSVLGYRVALIVIGSAGFVLADRFTWPVVYLLAAALMLAVLVASLRVPEPVVQAAPESMADSVKLPFVEYFKRIGALRGAWILVFIILYRFGDSLITNMTTPFLLQSGFSQSEVGAVQGAVGLISTIVGILAGGEILSRIGLYSSLWLFGGLQAVSNLAYLALAEAGKHYALMVGTIVVENFCFGLGSAALLGLMISLCNPRFSATQYALLSSVLGFSRDVLVAPAGSIAQATGWPLFFLISFVAAVPALLLLPTIRDAVQYGSLLSRPQ